MEPVRFPRPCLWGVTKMALSRDLPWEYGQEGRLPGCLEKQSGKASWGEGTQRAVTELGSSQREVELPSRQASRLEVRAWTVLPQQAPPPGRLPSLE